MSRKQPLRPDIRDRSRALRSQPTDAEYVLWQRLRRRGLKGAKFRRQVPIGNFIVDFYCHEARLAVELDGGQHNEPFEQRYDRRRTELIEGTGVRVLRFWNNDVFENIEGVLTLIADELPPTPSPPPGGRGFSE